MRNAAEQAIEQRCAVPGDPSQGPYPASVAEVADELVEFVADLDASSARGLIDTLTARLADRRAAVVVALPAPIDPNEESPTWDADIFTTEIVGPERWVSLDLGALAELTGNRRLRGQVIFRPSEARAAAAGLLAAAAWSDRAAEGGAR